MTTRRRRFWAKVLLIQALVLVVVLGVGGGLAWYILVANFDSEVGRDAIAGVAVAAEQPVVVQLLSKVSLVDPKEASTGLTRKIRNTTNALVAVTANTAGHVFSYSDGQISGHQPIPPPDLESTGAPQQDARAIAPSAQPDTIVWNEIVRGRAPVFDSKGVRSGEVAIASPSQGSSQVSEFLLGISAGLIVGGLIVIVLSRQLRRRVSSLDPKELAILIKEQEITLGAIREGVICLDAAHRVRFINFAAARMIGLDQDRLRSLETLDDLVPQGRFQDALRGRLGDSEVLVVLNESVFMAAHTPIFVKGRQVGSVVTVRDRTEPESLLRELDGVLGLTAAMRAQAHEFSNRLHTLVGLVELGRYDDALRFVTGVSTVRNELIEALTRQIHDPMIVALLLAKTVVAAQKDISLHIHEETELHCPLVEPGEVVTILGNLVDNAIDAAISGQGDDGWVTVKLKVDGDNLEIRVSDSGPGIPVPLESSVFIDGFTTKASASGASRGLGLALVRGLVQHRGGTIDVTRDVGAVFSVVLPSSVERAEGTKW